MLPFSYLFGNVRLIAVLLAVNVFTSGAAYFVGRSDGRAIEKAEGMAAALAAQKADGFARDAQTKDNIAEIEAESNRELTNDEIEALLLRPSASDDACSLNGSFVRNLQRLK